MLIGAEIPLLMTLIQRIRRQDAGGAVADLFAADYVGALVGGLAFPFLLLPLLRPADRRAADRRGQRGGGRRCSCCGCSAAI